MSKLKRKKKIHIAIMKKSWGLTPKILTGEKTIESRWYKIRARPWDKISPGDDIYFKDAGGLVRVKARAGKVLQFANLTPSKIKSLLKRYNRSNGLGIDGEEFDKYFSLLKDKNYAIIIFLEDIKKIRSFQINKKRFGAMSSWITVGSLKEVKKK